MGVKRVTIVVVKHPNCATQYVFKVPKNVTLDCGDYILCSTKKNPCEIGRCVTPSFEIIEPQLIELYGRSVCQLQPVVGKLKPCMFLLKFDPDGE